MADMDSINSIVAADFGSVNTRVVLIDLVDGAYRLVAQSVTRTTADDPLRDVAVGLYRGLVKMSEQTGRMLFEERLRQIMMPERGDGSGVDALLATASVGRPLRVVVVGLMPDVSVTSALRVLSGSYVEVVDKISLADIRTEEQQVNAILAGKPDLIFIVGGTDAGAEAPILKLVSVVRSAIQIAAKKPMVLFAGNRAVQTDVRELLEEIAMLFVADNVRPSLLDEQLGPAQQGLAAVYNQFKVNDGGGFDEVSGFSEVGVLPTAQSYTNIVRYLGEVSGREQAFAGGVLAVDVGSSTTMVAASIQGRSSMTIRTDVGVGHSATDTLAATTPGNMRRWLTWDATDAEIEDYLYNKALRPATVPQSAEELELEYALAREAMRVVVEQARRGWRIAKKDKMPRLSPIIGGGMVLSNAAHAGVAALLMLDAIQPVGVTEVWLDPSGLIPALGALAYLKPSAVVQILDAGDLLKIGSVVCVEGKVRRIGRGGMRVVIKLPDGYVVRRQIAAGTVWTYPLPPGQTAIVQIRLSRGMTVNGKSRLRLRLEGGAAGLIFDVRGRPLPLPRNAEARARLYPAWMAGMKGVVQSRLGEEDASLVDQDDLAKVEFLTEAEVATPAADTGAGIEVADAKPGRRRGLFGRRKPDPEDELDVPLPPDSVFEPELVAEDAPEEAPPEKPAKESAELALMVDELRDSTAEEKKKKPRLFRR